MDQETELRIEELTRRAEAFWSGRGSRMTTVRRVLCRTIFAIQGSLDAEELLRKARESDKLISLSTVYRTLSDLVDAGLLVVVEGRDGKKNYNPVDSATQATSHIVCEDCGHVIPVANPCLALREGSAARAAGFQPSKISLRIEASCDELKRTGKCANCRP